MHALVILEVFDLIVFKLHTPSSTAASFEILRFPTELHSVALPK